MHRSMSPRLFGSLLICAACQAPAAPPVTAAAPSAATAPPAATEPAAPAAPPDAAPTPAAAPAAPGASIEPFFRTLAGGDAARAREVFDAAMKQGLSAEQLAKVWSSQTGSLGALASVRVGTGMNRSSFQVHSVELGFEHGALQATVSLHSDTGQFAGLFLRPARSEAPAPYVDAASFHGEEVAVGREPFVLSGTLDVPSGSGPFPGVVLVHGSGPNDRDESIGANRPFKDLAEGLASRGVVVLRYDKRTFQHAARLDKDIGIDAEVVLDATYALEALRARKEVDPGRVFVLGHSLGAQLAPEIAQRAGHVAGLALLAPPGRLPWDVMVDQLRYLGAPAENIAAMEKAAAGLRDGSLREGNVFGAPVAYWRDWAARDGAATARKLKAPLLILHGSRDYQVTDADIAIWRKQLEGRPHVEIVTIPEANHLFILGTGKPGPAEYATPGHVDATVVIKLASFFTSAPAPRQ